MAGGEGVGAGDAGRRPPRRRRSAPARRRRLDPETARSELLAAGLGLVVERSLGDTLGHLRINDLARDGRLTSGAFYHYWDGQGDYRAEVLRALLAVERADADPDLFARPDATVDTLSHDPAAAVDDTTRRAFARLADDPDHRLELALWAHDDPQARGPLLRRARRTDAAWARTLASCLARHGRAPTAGWRLVELATAAVTLSDGLRTQHLIDPTTVADRIDPSGRTWSTPGLLALLLLVGATEVGSPVAVPDPAEGADDRAPEVNPRRQRLVALGMSAARARPTGNALDHIRADDVARRRGLTIGAFYHYWETQDDYRDDLVDALFAAERYVDPGRIEAQSEMIADAGDLDTAVREATSWYWSVAAGHPENRVLFGFHALDDPYIAPRLAAEAADLRRAWHLVLETLLSRFGRRWRAPLDTGLVVLGMSAALDGLIVRHGLDPGGLGPDDDGWTLWGRTCRALVTAGTAAGDDDDTDLATTARRALGAT